MEGSRELVTSVAHSLKPNRRKLKKTNPRPLLLGSSAFDVSSNSIERTVSAPAQHHHHALESPRRPTIPMPSNLSDNRWLEHIHQSGLMSADNKSFSRSSSEPKAAQLEPVPQQQQQHSSPPPIPEFSHLRLEHIDRRPSLDSPTAVSPRSSTSTASTMRWQAKTPVFNIGQLEQSTLKKRRWRAAHSDNSGCSVDMIAQQYKALIDDQNDFEEDAIYPESRTEPSLSPTYPPGSGLSNSSRPHSTTAQMTGPRLVVEDAGIRDPGGSPTSDTGTLIGFEEDVIYFKPVSFSPASSPQPQQQSFTPQALSAAKYRPHGDSPTSLKLLTDELLSGLAPDGGDPARDMSALQIQVMIESYQRLRNQVASSGPDGRPANPTLAGAFDNWLDALQEVKHTIGNDGPGNTVRRKQTPLVPE